MRHTELLQGGYTNKSNLEKETGEAKYASSVHLNLMAKQYPKTKCCQIGLRVVAIGVSIMKAPRPWIVRQVNAWRNATPEMAQVL